MSEVKFLIDVDYTNDAITFTDNGTDWSPFMGSLSKLTIYMKGEDKEDYIVKMEITDGDDISLFQAAGIEYTFSELFGRIKPLDNFYLVEVVANEGETNQMLSEKMAVGFTYDVAELIHNSTVGVHIPVTDLFTSLTIGMMPQALELLKVLSLEAAYTYDRENKWRKIYNHLYTIVNDLEY
jgi:hypothetical protein